jgi:hypothetical protein
VYIGEAAQTLVQHVDYEIPYLRKQMAKCSQGMADAQRRQGEYERSAAACAANYKKVRGCVFGHVAGITLAQPNTRLPLVSRVTALSGHTQPLPACLPGGPTQECEKLGITGSGAAVQTELAQLTQQLPGLFESLVGDLRSTQLAPAISFYQHFTAYAHSSSGSSTAQQQQALPDVLPVLTEVRQGNTAPPKAAAAAAADAANNSAAGGGGIDWDLGGGGSGGDAAAGGGSGISWDLGLDVSAAAGAGGEAAAEAGGISWDFAVEPADDTAAAGGGNSSAAAAGAGPSLDWDIDLSGIDVEGSGQDASAAGVNWDIDMGAAGGSGDSTAAAAGGGDSTAAATASSGDASAARLQADSEYRAQLVDDLQELRAFLLARQAGLSGASASQDLLRALAPEAVASTDARDVGAMLAVVEGCLAQLNGEQLRQLLMIASSPR